MDQKRDSLYSYSKIIKSKSVKQSSSNYSLKSSSPNRKYEK